MVIQLYLNGELEYEVYGNYAIRKKTARPTRTISMQKIESIELGD